MEIIEMFHLGSETFYWLCKVVDLPRYSFKFSLIKELTMVASTKMTFPGSVTLTRLFA